VKEVLDPVSQLKLVVKSLKLQTLIGRSMYARSAAGERVTRESSKRVVVWGQELPYLGEAMASRGCTTRMLHVIVSAPAAV
jgi:hypothetical protein